MQLAWSGETWQLKSAQNPNAAAAALGGSRFSMAAINNNISGRNSSGGGGGSAGNGGQQIHGLGEEPLLTKVEVERDALAALTDR
jgi:hypothetical protein